MPEKLYVEADFRGAGQDSYTQPPAQDQKLFEVLENVLPVTQGPLYKRWGYSLFKTLSNIPRRLYEYQSDLTGIRRIIVSSKDKVRSLTEAGVDDNTSILTPDVSAIDPRVLVSRDFAYIADGVQADAVKWDGSSSGGTSNWGIASTGSADTSDTNSAGSGATAGSGAAWANPGNITSADDSRATATLEVQIANEGPNSPATVVDDSSVGTVAWANPSNAKTSDNSFAVVTLNGVSSHRLKATGLGFSIPGGATINGIVVEVERKISGEDAFSASSLNNIRLLKGGAFIGDNRTGGIIETTEVIESFGNSEDLWGTTWTVANINAADFGVGIGAKNTSGPFSVGEEAAVDHIKITVHYSAPTGDGLSQRLEAKTFGFAVSSGAEIRGIEVKVERSQGGSTPDIRDNQLRLLKAGTVVGSDKADIFTAWPTTDAIQTYGGPTDLWGEAWVVGDVNAANFGVMLTAGVSGTSGTETARVDHIQITVFFDTAMSLSAPVGGSVTLEIGRKYTYLYRNSTTGHNSDIGQFSASTGVLSSEDQPLTGIPVSNDSQVDRKYVLATADGGDETRLYFLADIPNATTTLTDDVPEETLLLRNVYLNINFFGEERGVSGNLPPPRITIPIKHRARIWGAGNPDNPQLLYYSKNLSELITDTGIIAGRYEECWPAENFLDVSGGAESITALFSDGQTLYVASERQIRRILGDPPSLLIPEVVFNNVGVVNPEVWKPVFIEGTPAGTIFLTPDRRVIFTDFNTYRDIGGPIQDILDTLNASEIQKSRAEFFSDGPHEWYLLAIPTGANTESDTLLVYHLKAKRWYVWKPTDNVTAMLHNVQADGTVQFLFGADTSKTYKFNSSDTQDRVNDTPVSFTSTITTTWRHYGVPATLKLLNKLKIFSSDSAMQVTVDGASRQAEFTTPSNVVTDGVLAAGPLGDLELYLAGKTTKDKYYRYKFKSTIDLNQSSPMLNYFEVYYVPFHVF